MKNLYQMPSEEVLKQYGTSKDGLTDERAKEKLEKDGENALAEGKKNQPLVCLFLSLQIC